MSQEVMILAGTAALIALGHTLMGPDHYLPFVVMARARKWSLGRTAFITLLCGLGHVAGSIALGAVGILAGIAVAGLEVVEVIRGNIAAWLLVGFGLVYLVWGIRRGILNKPHTHIHAHLDGDDHAHEHCHHDAHLHVHHEKADKKRLTPWVLFLIFAFGPCEPLIPILMYPAATEGLWATGLVAAVFGAVTIATMLSAVLLLTFAAKKMPTSGLERYSHALAGLAILFCGVAIHMGL